MARSRVVVIGAAGFGRECLDVLEAMIASGAELDIAGVVDDSPSSMNLQRLQERDIHYLGTLSSWRTSHRDKNYILGIGNPEIRRKLVTRLNAAGMQPISAVHPNASIGAATTIADGVVVCAGAVISTNVRIGRQVHLNPNVTIGHDTVVGSFSSINPGAVVSGEVVISEGVLIGASATVLQQLIIGEDTVVGAGAVVTKNVPSRVVVKGVPGVWG